MSKKSPFSVGRKATKKASGGGSGLFLSIKADNNYEVVPMVGLDQMVHAQMHEYWDIRPAVFHPCIGKDCPGCLAGNDPRFKGYLPVIVKGESEPKVYAFTVSVYKQLEEIEDLQEDGTLAGKVLKIKRSGSGLKTRYTIMPTGKTVDINEVEVPDFIRFLGPTEVEGITSLLREAGAVEKGFFRSSGLSDEEGAAVDTGDDDDKWDF